MRAGVAVAGCLVLALAGAAPGRPFDGPFDALMVPSGVEGLTLPGSVEGANETKLFDFEDAADAGSWRAAQAEKSVSTEHATSGRQSLRVKLSGGGGPSGIATEGLVVRDWSGYATLKLDIFADDALTLLLTLRDRNARATHKVFRKDPLDLRKGANAVVIPIADVGAVIDLKTVQGMNLIATLDAGERTIYVDNIRLEK